MIIAKPTSIKMIIRKPSENDNKKTHPTKIITLIIIIIIRMFLKRTTSGGDVVHSMGELRLRSGHSPSS